MLNWALNQRIWGRIVRKRRSGKQDIRALMLIAAFGIPAVTACSPPQPKDDQSSSKEDPLDASAKANTTNVAIDAAASPAENLIEAVLADDANAGDRAYAKLQAAMIKLTPIELGRNMAVINELNQSLNAGWQADDRQAAAIAAVSLYASLQKAKNWSGSDVPLQVLMLDHAGLKSQLLASSSPTDWAEISATANDAQRDLGVINKTLKDANLKQGINRIAQHLVTGAKETDLGRVRSAARDLRAAVDVLKQRYSSQNNVAGAS